MRYYSEEEVKRILYDIDYKWQSLPQELEKYKHIKIKEPHGRLIDIDASRDDFMQTVYSELDSDGDNYRANRIIDAYDDALTIIEASN